MGRNHKKHIDKRRRHDLINGVLGKPCKMICTRCGKIASITGFTFSVAGMSGKPLLCFGCGEPTLERINSS